MRIRILKATGFGFGINFSLAASLLLRAAIGKTEMRDVLVQPVRFHHGHARRVVHAADNGGVITGREVPHNR